MVTVRKKSDRYILAVIVLKDSNWWLREGSASYILNSKLIILLQKLHYCQRAFLPHTRLTAQFVECGAWLPQYLMALTDCV